MSQSLIYPCKVQYPCTPSRSQHQQYRWPLSEVVLLLLEDRDAQAGFKVKGLGVKIALDPKWYLEGQGDLVRGLITPITPHSNPSYANYQPSY